jgi:hypothetical protein
VQAVGRRQHHPVRRIGGQARLQGVVERDALPGGDGIAVAGAGQIGRRHVEEIGRNPGTRLAAIVDPGPDPRPCLPVRGRRPVAPVPRRSGGLTPGLGPAQGRYPAGWHGIAVPLNRAILALAGAASGQGLAGDR